MYFTKITLVHPHNITLLKLLFYSDNCCIINNNNMFTTFLTNKIILLNYTIKNKQNFATNDKFSNAQLKIR